MDVVSELTDATGTGAYLCGIDYARVAFILRYKYAARRGNQPWASLAFTTLRNWIVAMIKAGLYDDAAREIDSFLTQCEAALGWLSTESLVLHCLRAACLLLRGYVRPKLSGWADLVQQKHLVWKKVYLEHRQVTNAFTLASHEFESLKWIYTHRADCLVLRFDDPEADGLYSLTPVMRYTEVMARRGSAASSQWREMNSSSELDGSRAWWKKPLDLSKKIKQAASEVAISRPWRAVSSSSRQDGSDTYMSSDSSPRALLLRADGNSWSDYPEDERIGPRDLREHSLALDPYAVTIASQSQDHVSVFSRSYRPLPSAHGAGETSDPSLAPQPSYF